MASRRQHSRSDRDSDSMEALKPLVVLVLFGTILYGAYSVVQKGPSTLPDETAAQGAGEAPAFAPPPVEMPPAGQPPATSLGAADPLAPPPASAAPSAPPVAGPVSLPPPPLAAAPPAAAVTLPAASPGADALPPPLPAAPPAPLVSAPAPAAAPIAPAAMPTDSPAASPMPAAPVAAAAAAGAAIGAAVASEAAQVSPAAPTYLAAETAPPPAQDSVPAAPVASQPAALSAAPAAAPPAVLDRPDRFATLATEAPPSAVTLPPAAAALVPSPSSAAVGSSAAFATAWSDAHTKLAAGRYAEALGGLSVWYDDPSLGLEESQRLEDLLGQLAGTVIYSQQDLLLPPHVVAPGETLPAIAAPLGVSWQILGKINGVADPNSLVPGEHLKVIRGPFDAVVSVSRRRLSLQLAGNYAGSFPVVVGRQCLGRVGSSIPVVEVRRGGTGAVQAAAATLPDAGAKPSIVLGDGFIIEAAEDPGVVSDTSPATSLVVSVRDLEELLDLLGPGSKVLVRQ
jgi:hypothetical protein